MTFLIWCAHAQIWYRTWPNWECACQYGTGSACTYLLWYRTLRVVDKHDSMAAHKTPEPPVVYSPNSHMASIDPINETMQVAENILSLSNDAVIETGNASALNADVPAGSIASAASIDAPPTDSSKPADQLYLKPNVSAFIDKEGRHFTVDTSLAEIRVAADGSYYVADTKRKADMPPPSTPVKKAKAKSVNPPPAPVKPAPVSRVSAPSPVVTQILAGIDQWPADDTFPELRDLVADLRGQYASYSLQRLLATYVGKISSQPHSYHPPSTVALHQLLLICFGYGSASQEARVILRDVIKLPNFISRDATVVLKHCKSLLGTNFPQEEQYLVIGVMRGLWHLFERVHILPTVFFSANGTNKWVYEDVGDCIAKAVGL